MNKNKDTIEQLKTMLKHEFSRQNPDKISIMITYYAIKKYKYTNRPIVVGTVMSESIHIIYEQMVDIIGRPTALGERLYQEACEYYIKENVRCIKMN